MKHFSLACTLGFAALLFPSTTRGQCTLSGTVSDSVTNERLVGVNVVLVGTSLGAATTIEGDFHISGISRKAYQVKFSYIGYESTLMEVDFSHTTTIQLAVRMNQAILKGEEVVVTAQMRGQIAAMNQQRTATTIMSVVSQEKIRELPDANAAEAIGRLPGVSLLRSGGEANKIILRGMSDKFTTVTIDGVKIPATDADSRGVDLSTIAQGSLAGIELFKALTPDKDADAIAGSVNLVTRKAPSERVLQADIKGDYNKLMNSAQQYDLGIRYGERFFDDVLGVQATGNLESRIRSNEQSTIYYQDFYNYNPPSYFVSNFRLQFVDETRKRQGFALLLDYNSPDSGSVRLSTNYDQTERDFVTFLRNYPTNNSQSTPVYHESRDQKQTIGTFNSSLHGENHLFGLDFNWGAAYAQSVTELPFDYYVDFFENQGRRDSTGHVASGMDIPANLFFRDNPGQIIPYAVNNFQATTMDSGIYNHEKNKQIENTAYLDVKKKYVLGDLISGELKGGGKYKYTTRYKEASRLFAPYYLGFGWQPKDLSGTRFADFYSRYLSQNLRSPLLSDFLDPTPRSRNLFDKYRLFPLMNGDAVHDWYELNKNGTAAANEYYVDNTADLDYYDIVERVSAGYAMNTLDIGQDITLITGLRAEQESNDYKSRFVPGTGSLGGFPTPTGQTKDTSTTYSETVWLPNFHLVVRPFDFMNVRFAAYKALARPDFNARLIKLYGYGTGTGTQVYLGNPSLRDSKAWNYEINTSIFSNTIGLISFSAYYKEISDDIHFLNGAGLSGPGFLDSLGIHWNTSLIKGAYQLTMPYNASVPTKVWGFEFEHQANLGFLPGYFQFLVLSYNFSIIRSETHLIGTAIDTTFKADTTEFGIVITPSYSNRVVDRKQKLEGQPEFLGNVTIGYDLGGFSARLSLYYQGEFNSTFSPGGLTDGVTGSYSRLDLTVKQKVTDNISLLLSISNLLDVEEDIYTVNRVYNWRRLNTSQRYGTTADFGVRVSL
jgi:TonB-dependent receptor